VTIWFNVFTVIYANCAQEEIDRVLGGATKPDLAQFRELQYTMRCINESMRLYPHPPVLIRRALKEDTLPGGYTIPKNQDVMISVYNIHRSAAVWDDPDEFRPERFPLNEPVPTELNTDFRCVSLAISISLPILAMVHRYTQLDARPLVLSSGNKITGLQRGLLGFCCILDLSIPYYSQLLSVRSSTSFSCVCRSTAPQFSAPLKDCHMGTCICEMGGRSTVD
jgi:hypothetical protein